ncbi:hypothetical protein K0U27_01370 [archaeon]|nr:hypothetical protein [archaeon]
MSEINLLKSENMQLRNYISLILAESQLTQRIFEIKQNFTNPDESERITLPISERLSRIKSEKQALENELNLTR